MKQFIILVMLFVSVLSGCGTGGNIFYVDERFTSEEEEKIQGAANMWAGATSGHVRIELVFGERVDLTDTGRKVIVKTTKRAAENYFHTWAPDKAVAEYYRSNDGFQKMIIVYYDKVDIDSFQSIVAHEMGHYFGISHLSNETALMYKSDHNGCVTKYDLEALHKVRDYDPLFDYPCDGDVIVTPVPK